LIIYSVCPSKKQVKEENIDICLLFFSFEKQLPYSAIFSTDLHLSASQEAQNFTS